ncbi:MAG: hypothetical protein BWY26_00436 [Elusimicrobia bacterium ADurb.Bin231]|nr:MAG: hypothetical protein BWY26_00436 [Elusimicrobia bacterium ADurb.Bin231]
MDFLAGEENLGRGDSVGIVIGNPSGITGRTFISDLDAVEAGLNVSPEIMCFVGYTRHNFKVLNVTEGLMPFYYGAGFMIGSDLFLIHLKAGIEYIFETNPLSVFMEAGPAFGTDFALYGGVGLRYRLR